MSVDSWSQLSASFTFQLPQSFIQLCHLLSKTYNLIVTAKFNPSWSQSLLTHFSLHTAATSSNISWFLVSVHHLILFFFFSKKICLCVLQWLLDISLISYYTCTIFPCCHFWNGNANSPNWEHRRHYGNGIPGDRPSNRHQSKRASLKDRVNMLSREIPKKPQPVRVHWSCNFRA